MPFAPTHRPPAISKPCTTYSVHKGLDPRVARCPSIVHFSITHFSIISTSTIDLSAHLRLCVSFFAPLSFDSGAPRAVNSVQIRPAADRRIKCVAKPLDAIDWTTNEQTTRPSPHQVLSANFVAGSPGALLYAIRRFDLGRLRRRIIFLLPA